MSHLYPWYLTCAAVGAAFCLACSLACIGVWLGDRSTAREYRRRTQQLGARPRCRVLDVRFDRHGQPMLPASLANGTPVHGVRLAGPYRRVRR